MFAGATELSRGDDHLKSLRMAELEAVRHFFFKGARVLEIGGGNGWQAKLLANWDCEVTSVDVDPVGSWGNTYFPVLKYDGRRLPFRDGSFDIVFSSNVLEHVARIDELLVEMRRVLKKQGTAVHLMPTPSWRLWTSLTHYAHLARRAISSAARGSRTSQPALPTAEAPKPTQPPWMRIRKLALAEAHGTATSPWREVVDFSRKRWVRQLKSAGYEVTEVFSAGVFYSGYAILPSIRISTRRMLARIIGSSCNVFVLKPVSS